MMHPDGRAIHYNGNFLPEQLRHFLGELESANTTLKVWTLVAQTAAALAFPFAEYIYATEFRNPERPQFVHSTLDTSCLNWSDGCPELRDISGFRSHGCEHLTPITFGISYFENMGTISADRRQYLTIASQHGVDAAVAFPLRMGIEGQAAQMSFGGPYSRPDFDDLLARHGWTLHVMSHSAHLRYTDLFKREVVAGYGLTEKQRELAGLVGLGMMDKQIAHTLGISFSAVRQRLATVQQKTGAQNRADLAALAMRLGLVPDPLLRGQDMPLTVFLGDQVKAAENIGLTGGKTDGSATNDPPSA